MNRVIVALCLILMVAFAIAGCGDEEADGGPGPGAYGLQSDDGESDSKDEAEKPKKRLMRASVWRADGTDVKRGIFDFDGFTLYRFDKDEGSKPTCYGACAKQWPPLLTEAKPKGIEVIKSELGTTKRKDGSLQVTYFGHPLYTFVGDKTTGRTTGSAKGHGVEAFGGTWYALRANGQDAKS